MVLTCVLTLGFGGLGAWQYSQAMETLRTGNSERRALMGRLLEERATYAVQLARQQRLEEQLDGNSLRMSTFVETLCTRLDVPRPREYTDRQVQRDGGITVLETAVEFDRLTLGQVDDLLNGIHATEELVFIQGVKISPVRNATDGALRLELTLVTYRRSQGGRE
jgi:hypothetical protein